MSQAMLLYQQLLTQPATQPAAAQPAPRPGSNNHDMDGQNVLFADGHPEFICTPLVGMNTPPTDSSSTTRPTSTPATETPR